MTDGNYFNLKNLIREKESSSLNAFTTVNNNSTENELMSENGYIAAAVILFLIGVFGFFFNFAAIFILAKDKSLRTPFNMILLNLSCADFSVSVIGNPITFSAAVYRKWIFGRTVCVMYGFFMSLTGITSITTITVLSFERYLNIARPFHSKGFSIDNPKQIILGIWIYSFILTFPPLVGWGEYVNESADISCSVNWEQRNFEATTYIVYLFVFGLVIPVCIILFSYTKIILTVMQKKVPLGRVSKVEVRVALMTAVIVIVFLLAWTPYAVLALIVAFGDPKVVTPAVSVIPALIAKSSICYNPIIYAGLNNQIRKAGFKLWRLHRATANTSARYDVESRLNRNMPQTEEMPTEVFNITACTEMTSRYDRKKQLNEKTEKNNEETAA